jgi:hypothetical protein
MQPLDVAEAHAPALVALVDEVVVAVRLDDRRLGLDRLLDVEHVRQVLVGDLDRGGALAGGTLARRHDRDDRLAAVQDLALGQHRLVGIADVDQRQHGVPVVRHVGVREDLDHALDLLGGRRVDADDGRVMALGAVHPQMQHPGRVDVLEVLRAAGDVAKRVQALDRLADDAEAVGRGAHALIRSAASRIARMIDS